jgi:predicted nuclease of predicted toxin-antitoxin system
MVIRYFLDEMLSSVIADLTRRGGIDTVALHEVGQEGARDRGVLSFAAREGRCLVTVNHRDFTSITTEFFEQGLPHAGVLLIAGSVPTNAYAAIAAALIRFAQENPDGLQPYEVRWLHVDLS